MRCSRFARSQAFIHRLDPALAAFFLPKAAKSVVSCSMELGGNAPLSCSTTRDLEAALDGGDDRQDAKCWRSLHCRQSFLCPGGHP